VGSIFGLCSSRVLSGTWNCKYWGKVRNLGPVVPMGVGKRLLDSVPMVSMWVCARDDIVMNGTLVSRLGFWLVSSSMMRL
jgi:hypothetical protein